MYLPDHVARDAKEKAEQILRQQAQREEQLALTLELMRATTAIAAAVLTRNPRDLLDDFRDANHVVGYSKDIAEKIMERCGFKRAQGA